MYEYIRGKLVDYGEGYAVLDHTGLAYRLFTPVNYQDFLSKQSENVTLYSSFVVRENSQSLYGFISKAERDTFDVLVEISGVGPKLALAIVGAMAVQDLIQAVHAGDILTMSRIPGIGKKKAEKLIVEIKNKLGKFPSEFDKRALAVVKTSPLASDAMNALMNLGYTRVAAQYAIQKIQEQDPEIELTSLITAALRIVSCGKNSG